MFVLQLQTGGPDGTRVCRLIAPAKLPNSVENAGQTSQQCNQHSGAQCTLMPGLLGLAFADLHDCQSDLDLLHSLALVALTHSHSRPGSLLGPWGLCMHRQIRTAHLSAGAD